MSSTMLEELEIKEPTPSLAPSQYESPLYTKKWRIILAVLLGVTLMGLCILGFYVSVKARAAANEGVTAQSTTTTTTQPPRKEISDWRSGPTCLSLLNDTCEDFSSPPLLVLALDGLQPDQITEGITPALAYLRKCGATAESLVPTYPTVTFPNMYTIATGLYPETHGIVDNQMYDPRNNKTFNINNITAISFEGWWGGEPIWNTVSEQGKKSATISWPGSDAFIQGRYPVYKRSFQSLVSFEERINQVQYWLSLPNHERPHLIMVYYNQPMKTIREFGLDSQEARNELLKTDEGVDELMNLLHQHNISHCLNVMVVSDHGVAPVSCNNNYHLRSIKQDIEKLTHIYSGAVGRVRAKGDKTKDEILELMRCKNSKVRALDKTQVPRRYHYANNPRIEEVILDTTERTIMRTHSDNECLKAAHGFNNLDPLMQATFIGFGPDFKVNETSRSFRNVELYNLMCQLLHIKPASNNGTAGSLNHLLRQPSTHPTTTHTYTISEEHLPPPDDMFDHENTKECHCFPPDVDNTPVAESLVRVRRNSSNDDGNNDNNNDGSNSSSHNTSTTTPATTTTSPTTTPSTTPSSTTTTTTPPPTTTPSSTTTTTTTTTTTAPSTTTPPTTTPSTTTTTTSLPPAPDTTSSTTTTTTPTTSTTTTTAPDNTESSTTTTPTTTTTASTTTTTPTTTTTTTTTTITTTTTPTTTTPPTTTMSQAELSLLFNTHVPWGSLGLALQGNIGDSLKILLQSNYVIGLHETLNLGVWVSFTITNHTIKQLEEQEYGEDLPPTPCWRADPRLSRREKDQCQRMLTMDAYNDANVTLVQLFPQELETIELQKAHGHLLSNLAPLRKGYLNGAHTAMVKAIKDWAMSFGVINVVHGPVFDYDLDGHQDYVPHVLNTVKPLVPSDYFFVITQCGSTPCPDKPKDVRAFVFPNTQVPDNCQMSDSEYLNYHLTTVRDIELLTGLHFFRNVYDHSALELRVEQPLASWPISSMNEAHTLFQLNNRIGKSGILYTDEDSQLL